MSSFDLGQKLAGKHLLGFGVAAGRIARLATPKIGVVLVCFRAGTLIETDRGPRAIETLTIGDTVVTFDGGTAPVVWLGSRLIQAAEAVSTGVSPIRIRAGALEDGVPSRDLFVSPGHCLFLDGLLVEARCLVNGASITQETAHEPVEYFHLELPRHGVVMSEGAPAESFLDVGNRAHLTPLDHSDASPRLASPADAEKCAPQIVGGDALIAIQTRLAARSDALGLQTHEPDLHIVRDGVAVRPEIDGTTYRFALGTDPADVTIVSRSSVPAERQFGNPDHRRLGVAFELDPTVRRDVGHERRPSPPAADGRILWPGRRFPLDRRPRDPARVGARHLDGADDAHAHRPPRQRLPGRRSAGETRRLIGDALVGIGEQPRGTGREARVCRDGRPPLGIT